MAEESRPSEDERRFLEILEQAALHDYPNPERRGCPGAEFLRTLASDRKSIPIGDPRLDHLSRCSPCFREFTAYRDQIKHSRSRRKRAGVIGAVAAAVALPAIWLWTQGGTPETRPDIVRTPEQVDYAKAQLDLKNRSVTRGRQQASPGADDRLVLPRQRLDLSILLPVGSETGTYEVQILREVDQPLVSATATAERQNGDSIVRFRTDLSKLPEGKYLLGLRQPPWDWSYNPILLK
jgi:hypothetical protein